MEASALTQASRRGLIARKTRLLKLQGDERLIAMVRSGNAGAFETIVDRYQPRLLAFCRQMLGSTEDAEDVLQEVFVNAYKAMLADEREINLRPWLYRIARNRCLNHLRKPSADAQESMDMVPAADAASTAERVHNREEFRQILSDVNKLPETQRTALLLREMDALTYDEIAAAMDTTVPSVKSLLVRARISLAEASQARLLTCNEVRVELSEAAEGLRKASAPVRRHVRECEECADFRAQIRSNERALAALYPVGPLVAIKAFLASKLGFGGAAGAGAGGSGAAGAGAGAAGAASAGAAGAAGAGAVGAGAAAISGSGAASGIGGAIGSAIGAKAVAGVVTAAVLTAGAAVEVKQYAGSAGSEPEPHASVTRVVRHAPPLIADAQPAPAAEEAEPAAAPVATEPQPEPAPAPPPAEPAAPAAAAPAAVAPEASSEDETGGTGTGSVKKAAPSATTPGAHGGTATVVVTVAADPTPPAPPAEAPAPPVDPPPPTEAPPPPAETPAPPTDSGETAPAPAP